MKISQLFSIPLVTTIAGMTTFGFASPTKAQYLETNYIATVKVESDSILNVRSGAGTNFRTVRWSLVNGDGVIILNDRPNAGDASPLIRKDRLGNKWYMVARHTIRQRESEGMLVGALVPESQRGWVRADFLRVIQCPH
jgi:hypothetical protein